MALESFAHAPALSSPPAHHATVNGMREDIGQEIMMNLFFVDDWTMEEFGRFMTLPEF